MLANGLVGAGLGAAGSAAMGGDPGKGAMMGGLGGAVGGGVSGMAGGAGGASGAMANNAVQGMSQAGQGALKAGTSLAEIGAHSSPAAGGALSQLAASSQPLAGGLANAGTSMGQIAAQSSPAMAGGMNMASAQPGLLSTLGTKLQGKGPDMLLAGAQMMNGPQQQQPQVIMPPAPQQRPMQPFQRPGMIPMGIPMRRF